jgi:hypothetical protein
LRGALTQHGPSVLSAERERFIREANPPIQPFEISTQLRKVQRFESRKRRHAAIRFSDVLAPILLSMRGLARSFQRKATIDYESVHQNQFKGQQKRYRDF